MLNIKLVFQDWQDKKGLSVYGTSLSDGQFHSGTTFRGMSKNLKKRLQKGSTLCFMLFFHNEKNQPERSESAVVTLLSDFFNVGGKHEI